MPPVRVLLVTETFLPEIGGGETQARMLSSALVRRGHEVTILTRRSRRSLPRQETVDGVRILRIGPAGPGRWRKWGLVLTALWPLVRMRGRFDVAVVSGYRILGVPGVLATRLGHGACILKADSTGEMSGEFYRPGLAKLRLTLRSVPVRIALRLRNWLLRRAEGFVAISAEIANELRDGGVPEERVFLVPNGVDMTRFRPARPAERDSLRARLGLPPGPLVTYTGRLVSYKGLPLLLSVWESLVAEGTRGTLVLVGPGGADMHGCEDELRAYVAAAGLEGSVRFTGAVDNVEDYLRASDIFVFPTENEAFGVSLIEAMACGLPSVATPVGGIPDFLVHGVNGLMVEPGSGPELRDALSLLLSAPDGRAHELGAAARASVVARFSEDAVADGYLAVFGSLSRRPLVGAET